MSRFPCLLCSRILFSSLLIALPKDEWYDTDDTYVGAEAQYIAELEREYFYIEGKAMSRLMVYLLETKTSLKADKIRKVHTCVYMHIRHLHRFCYQAKLKFDSKVNELRAQLKQSIRNEMTKQAYQSVSDKIVSGWDNLILSHYIYPAIACVIFADLGRGIDSLTSRLYWRDAVKIDRSEPLVLCSRAQCSYVVQHNVFIYSLP